MLNRRDDGNNVSMLLRGKRPIQIYTLILNSIQLMVFQVDYYAYHMSLVHSVSMTLTLSLLSMLSVYKPSTYYTISIIQYYTINWYLLPTFYAPRNDSPGNLHRSATRCRLLIVSAYERRANASFLKRSYDSVASNVILFFFSKIRTSERVDAKNINI